MISMRVRNLDKLLRKFDQAPRETQKAIIRAIKEAGGQAMNEVKEIITRGGYGSERAIRKGRMRKNISLETRGQVAIVQSSRRTDYAVYVHEGTYKMRARPFMTATKNKMDANKTLENILIKHLDKVI